jgi:phage protein D/phage baseplate assembly protein gpV
VRALAELPALVVEIDGTPLDEDALREVASVRVRQRLSAPAQCELSLNAAANADLPRPGADLRVGVTGHDTLLFAGQVTAVEHSFAPDRDHVLVVRAYDPLHQLRKSQRTRALVETTAEELAGELAAEIGLDVEAAASGPVWENVVQHRETDLELLVTLAERCGLHPVVRDGTLHLLTLEGTGDAVELTLGEGLLEARVELNAERACRSVTASGWDPLRAEAHSATVSSPRSGRTGDAEAPPDAVGGTGEVSLRDEFASGGEHVEGIAQAELDARTASEVTLWGLAEGDPRLRPGTPVEVAGVRDDLAGTYVLTEVVHSFDAQRGYVSELSTAAPEVRPRRTASLVSLAEVASVDDPDGRGRVRVRLSAYDDVESDWLGVVTPGAGPDRGIVALPDVGDTVLVMFAHEDPAAGIVLGGLYGTGGPPDPGVDDGAVRRFSARTAGGQGVVLDDVDEAVRLEDATGSSVELSPERVVLHSAVDLLIEAPGRAMTIRAKSVDFEEAK